MIYFNTDQYRYTVSDLLLLYIYKIKIKVYHKTLPQFKTNYSWFQSLASTKRKKTHTHTHNIKNRKFNCSLHTKKTNNTNKLPFYPYKNSKITKLIYIYIYIYIYFFFFFCTGRYARNRLIRPVYKSIRNSCILIPMHVLEW